MATTKAQRISIWVITIAMVVGTLGAYFIVFFQNNPTDSTADQAKLEQQLQEQAMKEQTVDPTAYKVDGKVTELKIEDLVVGTGEEAKASDKVKVHYKGTIASTGAKFDSSYDRGEPITIGLNEVIPGWTEGVPGMKVGGKRRLIIPSDKGYGAQGTLGIPGNSDLVFEIELLGLNPAE